MPRPKSAVPPYRHHKSTGRAVVYVDRKSVFLGKYDSPESRQRYAEIVSKITSGQTAELSRPNVARLSTINSVASLCLRFVAEKMPSYADAEQHCFRGAMRILVSLFGETPTADFGPIRLRTVRAAMVEGDPHAVDCKGEPKPRKPWSRSFVNHQIKRLRRLFSWGVGWEIVPGQVATDLGKVESLKLGETDAPEGRPRRSVPVADQLAVRGLLNPRQQDVFDLLLMTGARPGEIIGLTVGMIDRSGEVWKADLKWHKTRHMGKDRILYFNATARVILLRNMKADPDARLFPMRRDGFGQAIKAACEKAGIEPFVAHELRHTTATKLADEMGVEAAQRLLGHSSAAMTEHYSRGAQKKAIEAAKSLG